MPSNPPIRGEAARQLTERLPAAVARYDGDAVNDLLRGFHDLANAWEAEAARAIGSEARARATTEATTYRRAHALTTAFLRPGGDPELSMNGYLP